ncbi:phosphoesterase PA-phosphatase related protein [Pseudopedobacter saltans DSM 12145]|uniref:Phosphoesterase PA-phosphatase related protein n=1 Tax=Pseudopedobacter saltans (strain ATCC 51119 / DSM 12145 / JCM 21818 / CCUG 39354 / LMG 10337 / NBRC 100064 / NCIMB 13643) TaxID=762903 RepID=F0S6J7_PSESL|nr:phosphatase PAP2 family protein [Pseudopedobacter saltans]ADY51073.1 phosphoesterase PA-phosphatase related protein [Pseudopedobacter saltans DSM 12145]
MKTTIFLAIFLLISQVNFSEEIEKNDKQFVATITGDTSLLNARQAYKINTDLRFLYDRPRLQDAVNNVPNNLVNSLKDIVSTPYYPYSIAALGSSLALMPTDPWTIKQSRTIAENLNMSENHDYKNLGFLKIVPGNVNSAFYFLGNGTTVILIGGGLATYGLINDDYRSLSTSLQLMESLVVTGLFVQPLKRITGRESPFVTEAEGREYSHWTFAPSFKQYGRNTSRYDAMPSGHLTTAMSALVVIAENYPEKNWIKPVGYGLLGLLSFEMMQSKVHWASDYPIALLLGYITGKNIANQRIIREENRITKKKSIQKKIQLTTSSIYDI